MSDIALWDAYHTAAKAYMADALVLMADKSPDRGAGLLEAYAAWVRAFCPDDAEELIAEQRARIEAACAA